MRSSIFLAALTIVALLAMAPLASAGHGISITSGEPEGTTYTMQVSVQGFDLVPFQGNEAQKGEGHIHYLANGEDACSAGKADCSAATDYATPATSFQFTNLEPGDQLQAELVLSDHSASGTDSNGNLDGSRVLSDKVEVTGGSPGPGAVAVLALMGLTAMALYRRT